MERFAAGLPGKNSARRLPSDRRLPSAKDAQPDRSTLPGATSAPTQRLFRVIYGRSTTFTHSCCGCRGATGSASPRCQMTAEHLARTGYPHRDVRRCEWANYHRRDSIAIGSREFPMGCRRHKPFTAHDPHGLIAMPMARAPADFGRSSSDFSKLAIASAGPTTLPTAAKAMVGAVIMLFLLVGLVAPPGSGANSHGPSKTAISKPFAEWCPHFGASHVSGASIVDLLDRALMLLR